ncbi:MAG: hypothetical protein AB1679_32430 [Actinomycetota bacterium]|jgi:hypothetical protein
MLPFNRIYAPEELRAMSRLTPTGAQPYTGAAGTVDGPAGPGTRGTLARLVQRLLRRNAARRPAPGTI